MGWLMIRYPIPDDVLWSLRMITAFGAIFALLMLGVHGIALRQRQLADPLA